MGRDEKHFLYMDDLYLNFRLKPKICANVEVNYLSNHWNNWSSLPTKVASSSLHLKRVFFL